MQIFHSILDFIYPPICAGCNTFLEPTYLHLCSNCFQELDIVETNERCYRCFESNDQTHRCQKAVLDGLFASIPDSPIAQKLFTSSSFSIAPFLLYQWAFLPWPIPDLITITPGNKNVDRLLLLRQQAANDLSGLWNIPSEPSALFFQERLQNPFKPLENQTTPQDIRCLEIQHPERFINKKILIIHDLLQTKIALNTTAEALKKIGALEVYGLCMLYES